MNIFISGCAKTRTTLVQWLFTAFQGCIVVPGEMHLNAFRLSNLRDETNTHLVIKRTINSILAHSLTKDEYKDQMCRISVDGIKVVRVTRNRDDTLKSENGYVSPERYDDCQAQAEMLHSLIACEFDSDRLLNEPDQVQENVARALGLKIVHKWSTWPDFAPRQQMSYIQYSKIFHRLVS